MRRLVTIHGGGLVLLMMAALWVLAPAVVHAQYNTGPGFKISFALDPRSDPTNFRQVPYYGSSTLQVGMDFDRDGHREILFTTDETLSPGGPDPGFLDVYLMEANGNDSYTHVWHYTMPEATNSFPALAYGDIDKDGKYEIYFGVPTRNPSANKLFIFEQDDNYAFPDAPTLAYDYGRDPVLDFRPSGLQLADVDNDGNIEILTQSRTGGRRELVVIQLASGTFDQFASFEIEFEAGNDLLGGGGAYDVDIVDFDGDGKQEIWYNTWDLFSFTIFEADSADSYSLQVDFNTLFSNENDPGSFNRHDLFFADIDGDTKLEAWFPMTDGYLYYLDDTGDVSDSLSFHFTKVGGFAPSTISAGETRGTSVGDVDNDGRWDIIAGAGTQERIHRIEYLGIGSPKDSSSYEWSVILESVGGPLDFYYPLRVSPVDLDGDGLKEIVGTNRRASDASQPLIYVLEYDPSTANTLATDWETANAVGYTDVDSIFASSVSIAGNVRTEDRNNSRTVLAGMDLDNDGIKEAILTDYSTHAVRVFEYDAANDVFEQVWMSPPDTVPGVNRTLLSPRVVTVGDLDSDDKWEVVFHAASSPSGWYVYEWDGVAGSDNYGTIYSSVINTEVDTCCASSPTTFAATHEGIPYILDVDQDGTQEILLSIRTAPTGGKRGLLVSYVEGDIEHNAGGTGFETWRTEFFVDRGNYGGGSPYHAVPADLNGDGKLEIVNHTFQNFNFYNVAVTGPDTYQAPDPTSPTRFFRATVADQHAIFGGAPFDIDGDGNDEVYFPNFNSSDLYVVDYNPGDDVLSIDGTHVVNVVPKFSNFYASIFDVDKNGRANILSGGSYPKMIVSAELTGTNPRNPADYTTSVIYSGEPDAFRTISVKDSLGVVTTSYTNTAVFASKVQAHFNGDALDFDNDGDRELLASFQTSNINITTTTRTWNPTTSKYDTVVTKVPNPKSWAMMRFEFTGVGTGVEGRETTFITPDDYLLGQNYPNPFNPSTKIEYVLPIDKKVTLRIYNIMGQVVRTLVDAEQQIAGRHTVTWDGTNQNGARVASGVYIYSLEFGNFRKTRQMTLLK
jgi:hypothetical protein